MAILTFRVKGQTLTVESKIDKIVENSINYLDYEIIYDDEKWDSPLAKKVVVTYDKKAYEIFGDKIPSQVIHAPGFTVSVVGYKSGSEGNSGIIITTSPVAIKVFPSGAIEGTIPEDTAIDLSVAEQLNEKIEIQANEIKNNYLSKDLLKTTINENSTNLEVPAAKAVYDCIKPLKTELLEKVNKSDILSNIDINAKPEDIYNAPAVNAAIATLEQGIFKALPSGTVNLWELESGLYRVTANTTIKTSITDTLWKPVNPYSYLYVSGKSYMGSTDQRYVVGWAYLASTIYENSYAAKVFTGATYTDGTARGSTSELVTETKLTALEAKLGNKIETALMGKVDKSDVLSNIDKNANLKQIYDAPAVNTAIAALEQGTFKEITSPCHIAELEKGIYIVKNNFVGGYSGQVTFSNVTTDKTINDSYFMLNGGLLVVHENIKETEADGTETSIIGFTAQGTIGIPNKSYSGDVQGSPIEIETVESATSVQCYMLESTKFAESTAPYEANKWYSTIPDFVFSDIPASAIKNEITTESTIYDVPSALAVKNYVNESINALQGNLDEVSALVGGAQ